MVVSVEEAKQHLRVDSDEEDIYIQSIIAASEEFIKNATGRTFDETSKLAKVVILLMIADMYENRTMSVDKVGTKTRDIVSMMLVQLSYTN